MSTPTRNPIIGEESRATRGENDARKYYCADSVNKPLVVSVDGVAKPG